MKALDLNPTFSSESGATIWPDAMTNFVMYFYETHFVLLPLGCSVSYWLVILPWKNMLYIVLY